MSHVMHRSDGDEAAFKAVVLSSVVLMALALIVLRLGWLQIINEKHYKGQAVENSTRVTFLRAPRGSIYDRHGNLLATNKQSLSMIAIPNQLDHMEDLATRLCKILALEYPEVLNRLMKAKASGSVLPVVIEHDVDMEIVSRFYEQKIFLEGIDILPDISRTYPYADATAHVLGYCREITQSQLKDRPERKMGDVVGQAGIEKIYDDQLRGVDGEQRVRVNASGHALSPETSKPVVTKKAKPGLPIVTSIDVDLQRHAFNILAEKSGALVGCDPRSGEVLFLVSRPSFDPNVFTRRMTKEDRRVLNSPSHPLHNRALSGFPPGSIWKPVTLLAALDKKVVKPDTKLHVSGGLSLGGFTFHDWTGKAAVYNLVQCMQWSRDTAFYQMALGLEPEDIKLWGNRFGAGRPTGLELPNERSGLVPDSEWKMRRLHEKWYRGNTIHMSIGQTFLQVTPAQAARMYAGYGMGGRVPFLHLVIKIADRQIPAPRPEVWKVNPVYMKILHDGLKAVVEAGTAGRSRIPEVTMAGKTGSAEAPPKGSKTHGWFACYSPAENPEIACCGFVEHGGHGGTAAAPLVKQMVEQFNGIKRSTPGVKTESNAKPKPKAKKKPE
ncbi:penicillin-binding protein 2 [Candidatus Obscuribacterales bacterium]|nr:penicillin-binding protein 2 [Candidatus Obscuribacterales bacterium]MBX3148851.1 penicillin-binding protein 2 [Candidatus Obscuribacterales bacterium]